MIAARSTLRLAGGLANRRLLNPPELRAWPASDLLTNSVVQVLVNADGNVMSLNLLAGSGSPKADQFALEVGQRRRASNRCATAREADCRHADLRVAHRADTNPPRPAHP